ncbi:conserved hypothetical protein [Culex quinquefasciatus]|uniref:Uncharacterized protein n=2 Tax=Culex quinquefasciatus TaxID=7176 RepID=B0W4U3_CULQU|nr:conserved hypothetical protein [Culex quinquefasciatus]|eukprot:XP_001843727.1 conserved hypothetical protein [Culex quinquefasciatus]
MIQQWFILIIFVWNFSSNMAIITVDFDEDIRECGNGMPIPDVDLSQFSILPQDDGTMVVNGTVKIINGFGNPTRWNMYSKRQEQGKWNPGIISRDIPNFCAVLQLQTESWYQFTKHLKQGHCPIKAGYSESFDNLNIGNVASAFEIPAAFIGDWRIYNEITTFRNGRLEKECYMVPATIAEV